MPFIHFVINLSLPLYSSVGMLEPILHLLNKQRIVLASGSPRRKEILSQVVSFGIEFTNINEAFSRKWISNFHPLTQAPPNGFFIFLLKASSYLCKEIE